MILNFSSQLSKYRNVLNLFVPLFIFLYVFFEGSYLPHICLFEEVLKIKCSFCNLTNSFEELFKGNFISAFQINLMSYVVILFFITKFILNYFKKISKTLILEKVFVLFCLVQFFISNI